MSNPPEPTIAPGVDRRIRAAAAHHGISIEQLSDELRTTHPDTTGLGRANLKTLGKNQPARVEHLEAIANVTGMPLWYLVAGTDGLDYAHQPAALDTVPSETLAEVQALRSELRQLTDRLKAQDEQA